LPSLHAGNSTLLVEEEARQRLHVVVDLGDRAEVGSVTISDEAIRRGSVDVVDDYMQTRRASLDQQASNCRMQEGNSASKRPSASARAAKSSGSASRSRT